MGGVLRFRGFRQAFQTALLAGLYPGCNLPGPVFVEQPVQRHLDEAGIADMLTLVIVGISNRLGDPAQAFRIQPVIGIELEGLQDIQGFQNLDA